MPALGLSCNMWDLVLWPGIEPEPPALGTWNLIHWTTREVPPDNFREKESTCGKRQGWTVSFIFSIVSPPGITAFHGHTLTLAYFFLLNLIYFNWRIITLQYCNGGDTCIPMARWYWCMAITLAYYSESSADKKAHVHEAEIIISNLQVKKVKSDLIKISLCKRHTRTKLKTTPQLSP